MNCQDFNSVLDTLALTELSAAQTRDIERHFASCQTCRDAWAAYRELAAAPIPETPPGLHRRIATALEEQEQSDAHRLRRTIITGGMLVAGAALATTLSLGLVQNERVFGRT